MTIRMASSLSPRDGSLRTHFLLGSFQGEFPAMETIFVITANRFFRESLIRLFRSDKRFRVTGAADCSPLIGVQGTRVNPEIVVLRPEWDDRAFFTTRAIHEAAPQTKILMIGMEDDQEMFLKAVQAGAEGYLLRDASAKQILAAAHRLEQNAVVCPRHLERALFNVIAKGPRLNTTHRRSTCELTPREHQLTSLVAQGLANKEIAGRLNLSLQTVKNHVHSILQKTQSKNRAMLAQLVESRPSGNGPTGKLVSRLSVPF
jgi:two-component system, NarL family, nitrate/nitrite response regulator NarL